MKIKLLTLIAIACMSISVKSQVVVNGCIVTMNESTDQNLFYKNDTISVRFTPSETFWHVKLENISKNDLSIAWDKSSFIVEGSSSKIIFDNTITINKDNPISDEQIPSESYIEKSIFPVELLEVRLPTISKRFVTKRFKETGQPDKIKIILALKNGNTLKNYAFNFNVQPEAKK